MTPREQLRVLHVLEALEGGTARHVVDLVRWTPSVEQHVVVPPRRIGGCTDTTATAAMRSDGATVHEIAMTRSPATRVNASALRALDALVARLRPDVVHAHSSIGGLLGRLVALRRRLPVLYTPNGITDHRGGILVERLLARVTTTLVAVSPSEADEARRLRIGPPAPVVVVANGVDVDRELPAIDLRALLALDPEVPLVGTVARLVPQKDPSTWLDMAARVHASRPDVRFVMIGDGAMRGQVESALDRLHLRDVCFLVPELAGAAGALASLDVFALSSAFEGAPYAPMEAMAAGTPVVLTDVTGNRDLVDDGVDGLLVPRSDGVALAAAVLSLLTDRAEAARLGSAGRATVAARFDVRTVGEQLRQLYDEVR